MHLTLNQDYVVSITTLPARLKEMKNMKKVKVIKQKHRT